MPEIIMFGDIVEANGKTIRENNLEKQHKYPLGTLVEVDVHIDKSYDEVRVELKGRCKLFVVGHGRDCDGTPLYHLSDLPVEFPTGPIFSDYANRYRAFASLVEINYGEQSLTPTGHRMPLFKNLREYFEL